MRSSKREPTTVAVKGVIFERVRNNGDTCRDCGVERGALHVTFCCIEACPRCGAQRLTCLCNDDDGDTP